MEITYLSAGQLAAAIRAKEVSAEEVFEAHLSQIEEHNAPLNAVVTLDAARARKRAREADEALSRGESWGPLHGVPFTLKDCHSTAGMRTTAGFLPLSEYVPAEDGTVAARLKAAGGVLMGKTNVPPLLMDFQSDNPIFGRTNNPWNLERTPGGSSGGAAAALATGMTPFEIGSDIGGSIRIPSHFCGLFGLKTTENRVPLVGHIPDLPDHPRSVRLMGTIGPMARNVEDLALLYGLIAGPDGRDTEVQPVPVDPIPEIDLKATRIAVAETFPDYPISAETRVAMHELAAKLAQHCHVVEEAALPAVDYDMDRLFEPARMAIMSMEAAGGDEPITLKTYLESLDHRDQLIVAWERFFESWDALICPVAMSTAFEHCDTGGPRQLDGTEVDYWAGNAHCKLFNYTGHPSVAMPFKLDSAGLPLGYQIVGKRWSESGLLAIAEALSEISGPFRRPPGY